MASETSPVQNGNRRGTLVYANTPNLQIGHFHIRKDTITLPSGLEVTGVNGQRIQDFLSIGTLAVAVRHNRVGFHDYVPVSIRDEDDENQIITPFADLRFGAFDFGLEVGQLKLHETESIAAGRPTIVPTISRLALPPIEEV